MFCDQCGKENPDSDAFCWNCGSALVQDSPKETPLPEPEIAKSPTPPVVPASEPPSPPPAEEEIKKAEPAKPAAPPGVSKEVPETTRKNAAHTPNAGKLPDKRLLIGGAAVVIIIIICAVLVLPAISSQNAKEATEAAAAAAVPVDYRSNSAAVNTVQLSVQPTQTLPKDTDLSFQTEKDVTNAMVIVRFAGGPGQNVVKTTRVVLTRSDGSTTEGTLDVSKQMSEVTLQGSRGTDRVQIIVTQLSGTSYTVVDKLLPYRTRG